MSCLASHSAVSLKQKISTIHDALRQIESIKKKIHENANETKSHIQSAVSRQLESLRNREVWLVEQVHLLQATKQTLSKQTHDLFETLGQLESCLQCVQSLDLNTPQTHHHLFNLGKAIDNCIVRFETLELNAREDPYLSFRGDMSALRACIQKFGTIDSTAVCAAVFSDEQAVKSASLPPAMEEYEDEEHHVLYKPLSANRPTMISMHVPKPTVRPEDWLFLPSNVRAPPEPEPATFQVDVQQWLADRKLNPSPSTHQWLNDLQSQCATEEEGYEVVARHAPAASVASDIEILSHGDFSQTSGQDSTAAGGLDSAESAGGVEVYFERVQEQPSSQWLAQGNLATTSCPYLKMKYFTEISNNLRDWLLHYAEEMKEDEDRDVCCGEGKCAPASVTQQHVDIENLHELVCVQPPTPPPARRRQTPPPARRAPEIPFTWRLTQGVSDLCKANEPCQTFAECCSPDNCCSEAFSRPSAHISADKNHKSSSVQEWLRSVESAVPMDIEPDNCPDSKMFPDSFNEEAHESGFASEWLSKSSQNGKEGSSVVSSYDGPFCSPICSGEGSTKWNSLSTGGSEKVGPETSNWLKGGNSSADKKSHLPTSLNKKSEISSWLRNMKINSDGYKSDSEKEDLRWLKGNEKADKVKQEGGSSFSSGQTQSDVKSWMIKSVLKSVESEDNISLKGKGVDLPKYDEKEFVWLLSDKQNIMPDAEKMKLCGNMTTTRPVHKVKKNTWLID